MFVVRSSSGQMLALFLLASLLVTELDATLVQSCSEPQAGRTLDVDLGACQVPPCTLRRNTDAIVKIRFTPETEVRSLRNSVSALLLFWLPYPGVDGTSAGSDVYNADGATRAAFPLRPGTEYVYKHNLHVERYYPSISPLVYWALKDSNNNNVACFQVYTRITS